MIGRMSPVPAAGWRPGAASGGRRGVWQVGERGSDEAEKSEQEDGNSSAPRSAQTKRPRPETHARLYYHVTGPLHRPTCQWHVAAPVSSCLPCRPSILRQPRRGALKASPAKNVGQRRLAVSLPPSRSRREFTLQISISNTTAKKKSCDPEE